MYSSVSLCTVDGRTEHGTPTILNCEGVRPNKVNNVSATLQSNALRRPDRPALIQADEVVSWANLEWRVQHAAGALLDHGVRQGDIVAVSMADTIDQVVIIFALMRLGAVMLPLDVRWAQPESLRVANFFKASMLIVDNADGRDNNIPTVCIDAKWRESLSKAQAVRTLGYFA